MKRFVVLVALLLNIGLANVTNAESMKKDAVIDARGNPVLDSRGDCVRTRWNGGNEECDGKKPEHVQKQLASITKENRSVWFDSNKYNLTTENMNGLDEFLRKLGAAKEVVRGTIVGYADEMGKDDYNRELSNKRAEAVKGYLMARDFKNIGAVELRGLGESGSVTNCDPALKRAEKIACLRQDRRVEIELELVK